jgi:type VI secretion system protein ImpG
MLAADDNAIFGIKHYFEQELQRLRDDAAAFARDYPAIAQELALSRGKSADPQVELLIQSFAFLVGRLRHELDADEAAIPNALLEQLYPYMTAPIPSMAVAQVDVRAAGANFVNGWTLVRDRQFLATATSDSGRRVPCRFQNCYDTPLWPLAISDAGLVPINEYDFLSTRRDVYSVLRVRVTAVGADPIHELPLRSLRFHLHGDDLDPFRLYEMLAMHLVGLAVVVPNDPVARLRPPEALHWLGFANSHAVLPDRPDSAPAYRLLQEYSTFPEKFLFFDVQDLDCSGATAGFDLLFLLNAVDASLRVAPGALRLNCIPLINLYSQPFEPLRLDHRQYEYRLLGDQTAHPYCELYTLEEVRAIKPDGSSRAVVPYFAMEEYGKLERRDYFYATRREVSQSKLVPGTELYISLLDVQLDLAQTARETLGGRALCTNRRLPEQLRAEDLVQLEGPGPVNTARLLSKPTPHRTPRLLGSHPWSLVSQLSLNHLSLTRPGLNALKSILRLHAVHGGQRSWKQIDSVVGLRSEPLVRHMGADQWRGFCRGIGLHVLVDEERFEGASVLLFGEVLRHFFALYANVNSFTQLTLESQQRKEEIRTWPPLAGAQIVL